MLEKAVDRRSVLKAGGAIAVGSAALAACGGSSKSNGSTDALPADGSTVTLALLVESLSLGWWKSLIELFNQTSKFKVKAKFTVISNVNAKTQLPTALSSRDAPDLAYTLVGRSVAGGLVKANLVRDLTSYAKKYGWQKRFGAAEWDSFRQGGILPTVAYDAVPHTFIWYKPPVFQRLGLTVPGNRVVTKDQMDQFVQAAKAHGQQGVALGNHDFWPASQTMSMCVQRTLSDADLVKLQSAWYKDVDIKWTDAGPIEAITRAQQSLQSWYAPSFNSLTDADAGTLLVKDKSAMYQDGYWFETQFPTLDPKGKYDFFQFPTFDSNVPVRLINFGANGMVLPKNGKNPAAAAALYDFMIGTKAQSLRMSKFGSYPGILGIDKAPNVTYPTEALRNVVTLMGTVETSPFQMENDAPSEIAQDMMKLTATLASGQLSPADFGKKLQAMIDTNIKENS